MKMKQLLDTALVFGKKNLPEILTVVSTVGLVTTGVLAFKAGRKADKVIMKKKKDMADVDPNDKEAKRAVMWETVKEVTPIVAPPIILGGVTIVSIFTSNRVSNKRIVALSAAYSLSESALKDLNVKMGDILGEKKAQDIKDAVASERVKRAEENGTIHVVHTGNNKIKCMDGYLGTTFDSTYQEVQNAINKITAQALSESYVSINDFYDYLGLKHYPVGDELGWRDEDFYGQISPFSLTSTLSEDGIPILVIMYEVSIKEQYWKGYN